MGENDKADIFLNIFRDLALGYNRELNLPQVMSYFGVLKDLDLRDVKSAALHLRRTSPYFPSAAEWYRIATAYSVERENDSLPELPAGEVFCSVCNDTGWEPSTAGFVRPCGCRSKNTVLAKKRAILMRQRSANG